MHGIGGGGACREERDTLQQVVTLLHCIRQQRSRIVELCSAFPSSERV